MSDNVCGKCVAVNESADLSAMTVANNVSESDDMGQLLHDGTNITEDMVRYLYRFKATSINMPDGIHVSHLMHGKSQHLFAVRAPSTKNKFKGRRGGGEHSKDT